MEMMGRGWAIKVSANEKSSRTPPGLLRFGLETPHAVRAALLTGSHALIALALGLILDSTDSVSPAVRRASVVPEHLQMRVEALATSWGCLLW
jgi:hypothetical protein